MRISHSAGRLLSHYVSDVLPRLLPVRWVWLLAGLLLHAGCASLPG